MNDYALHELAVAISSQETKSLSDRSTPQVLFSTKLQIAFSRNDRHEAANLYSYFNLKTIQPQIPVRPKGGETKNQKLKINIFSRSPYPAGRGKDKFCK